MQVRQHPLTDKRAGLLPWLKNPPLPPPPKKEANKLPTVMAEQEQMDKSTILTLSTKPGTPHNWESEIIENPADTDSQYHLSTH